MRYTIGDLRTHHSREDIANWWLELPMRERFWWWQLLLEPGTGWFRWKPDWRSRTSYDPPDFEEWPVFPPLHRVWFLVRAWMHYPIEVLRGDVGWGEWYGRKDSHLLIDEDRKRLYQ